MTITPDQARELLNGTTPGPEVVLEDMGAESYDIFVMQPDEARHVALALLAAANYAEGNA